MRHYRPAPAPAPAPSMNGVISAKSLIPRKASKTYCANFPQRQLQKNCAPVQEMDKDLRKADIEKTSRSVASIT